MKNQIQARKQGKSKPQSRQTKKFNPAGKKLVTIRVPMSRELRTAIGRACKALKITRDEFFRLAVTAHMQGKGVA